MIPLLLLLFLSFSSSSPPLHQLGRQSAQDGHGAAGPASQHAPGRGEASRQHAPVTAGGGGLSRDLPGLLQHETVSGRRCSNQFGAGRLHAHPGRSDHRVECTVRERRRRKCVPMQIYLATVPSDDVKAHRSFYSRTHLHCCALFLPEMVLSFCCMCCSYPSFKKIHN